MNEKLCECGCGQVVKSGNRFIHGHNGKGIKRSNEIGKKISEAKTGVKFSSEHCKALSEAHIGIKLSSEHSKAISEALTGRKLSPEHCMAISRSQIKRFKDPNARKKSSESGMGHDVSMETRQRSSATRRGIPYDEWESFAIGSLYCPDFNEECKESNREKYGRMCFLTGLPEEENITRNNDQWKLSVHHVDMDKMQGCDGKRWKLVPLCLKWHRKVHNKLWEARIIWLLDNVWD